MKQQGNQQQKSTLKQAADLSMLHSSRFQIGAICCIALLLYFPSLSYQLIYYDDATLIENMRVFIAGHHSFFEIFSISVFGSAKGGSDFYYRPMLTLSLYLNELAGGNSLTGFHLTNILLHASSAVLLYMFLGKLKFDKQLSFISALFFIVHPAMVQAVAWIPGRNDSLVATFSLASLLMLVDYFEKRKMHFLIFHLLFFFIALLSKESAVFLPVLFVIAWKIFGTDKASKANTLAVKIYSIGIITISWVVLIAVFLLIRKAVLGSPVGLPQSFTIVNFVKNIPALIQYTGKMLLPFGLSTFPILKNTSFLFGIVTIALVSYFLYASKNLRHNYLLLAVCWWLLFLLPAILRTSDEYESVFLEHRLYFPLIGFLLLWLETDLLKKFNWSSVKSKIIVGAIVLLFSALTFINSKNYKDEFSYWSRAVSTSPDASFAHRSLGTSYFTSGKTAEAEKEYLLAMQLNPVLKEVRNNLGRIYLNNGSIEKAATLFNEELKINPESAVTYYNLALLQLNQKKLPEAENLIRKSLSFDPEYLDAQNDLCVILAMQKRYEEAIQMCIQILEKHPDYASARQNLLLIFKSWADPEKTSYYKKVLQQKGIAI